MKIQLKRSSQLENGKAKEPTVEQTEYGEIAVNYNTNDPTLFIKDSTNEIIPIAGDSHVIELIKENQQIAVGPFPPAPIFGALWLDTSQCPPELKVWTVCRVPAGEWLSISANRGTTQNPLYITSSDGNTFGATLTAIGGDGKDRDNQYLEPIYDWTGPKSFTGDQIVADIAGTYTVAATINDGSETFQTKTSWVINEIVGTINTPIIVKPGDGQGSGTFTNIISDKVTAVNNLTVDLEGDKDLEYMAGVLYQTDGQLSTSDDPIYRALDYTPITTPISNITGGANYSATVRKTGEKGINSGGGQFDYTEIDNSCFDGNTRTDTGPGVQVTQGTISHIFNPPLEIPAGKTLWGWIMKSNELTGYTPQVNGSGAIDPVNNNIDEMRRLVNGPVTVNTINWSQSRSGGYDDGSFFGISALYVATTGERPVGDNAIVSPMPGVLEFQAGNLDYDYFRVGDTIQNRGTKLLEIKDGKFIVDSEHTFNVNDQVELVDREGSSGMTGVGGFDQSSGNTILLSSNNGDFIVDNLRGIDTFLAGPRLQDTPLDTADVELQSTPFATTPEDADRLKNIVWELNGIEQAAGVSNPYKPTLSTNTTYSVRVKHQGEILVDSNWSPTTVFSTGATRNAAEANEAGISSLQQKIAALEARLEALE